MKIAGIAKLTLLDFPEKLACTVFLSGCNFRCPFCHNSSLASGDGEDIGEEAFFEFLESRRGKLEGVCITGGEPTLNDGLVEFAKRIKQLGYLVKLDTNGTSPEMLKRMCESGACDYVAMDIKNSESKYEMSAGCEGLSVELIKQSIEYLIGSDMEYEFRTTVVGCLHTEQDIEDISRMIRGAKRYFLQCYKESADVLSPNGLYPFSEEEMRRMCELSRSILGVTELRGV